MKLERTTIDRTTLADELLVLFKSHCRVEFTRDDDYLKSALTRAFDIFERLTEFHVFSASYRWNPPTSSVSGSIELPLQPVESFTVVDAGGGDVSADFEIVGTVGTDQMARQWLRPVSGNWPAGASVTLVTGYPTADDLPPGVLDISFRIGAFLYENREMIAIGGVDVAPYANSLITAYWVPRA